MLIAILPHSRTLFYRVFFCCVLRVIHTSLFKLTFMWAEIATLSQPRTKCIHLRKEDVHASFLLGFKLVSLGGFLYSCMATANITKISRWTFERPIFFEGFLVVTVLNDQSNEEFKWTLRLPSCNLIIV